MLLPSAVHVSSTFEFGVVFHDCLSADPQGNPPFSPFSEPHERYCLGLFMCPPHVMFCIFFLTLNSRPLHLRSSLFPSFPPSGSFFGTHSGSISSLIFLLQQQQCSSTKKLKRFIPHTSL